MKLYTAQCYDRHIDPVIRVFSTKEKAIEFAKQFAIDNAAHPTRITPPETLGSWIFYQQYSCESDYVCVEEVEVDQQ